MDKPTPGTSEGIHQTTSGLLVETDSDIYPKTITITQPTDVSPAGSVELVQFNEQRWQLRDAHTPTTASQQRLANELAALIPNHAEICIRDTPPLADGRNLLEQTGRHVTSKKGYYTRTLDELPDTPAHWTTTSLAHLGHRAFAEALRRCATSDQWSPRLQTEPDQELHEWIDDAGPRFEADRWVQVSDDQGPIGVILPQVYWDAPDLGSLFYIGVEPTRRHAGLGTALHAHGLHQIKAAGARRYAGSTYLGNTAMRHVFINNGCTLSHQQWFYTH